MKSHYSRNLISRVDGIKGIIRGSVTQSELSSQRFALTTKQEVRGEALGMKLRVGVNARRTPPVPQPEVAGRA